MSYVMMALGALSSLSSTRKHNREIKAAAEAVRAKTVATYNDLEARRREERANTEQIFRQLQSEAYKENAQMLVASGAQGITLENAPFITNADALGEASENLRRTEVQIGRQERAVFENASADINQLSAQQVGPLEGVMKAAASAMQFYQLGKDFTQQFKDAQPVEISKNTGLSTGGNSNG